MGRVTEKFADCLMSVSLGSIPALPRETAILCCLNCLAVILGHCPAPLSDILYHVAQTRTGNCKMNKCLSAPTRTEYATLQS